ncbi:MAG: 7-cyano-7-deazaguanine synthase QueC [Deltaproteobacteria bacterium]|nr:7-cyano-7-deazaguanine synthase QueC [Deltaproteobacteria bacterium]
MEVLKSICLLSGGLDSALALLSALETSCVVYALTFDYQHLCAKQEIKAAGLISEHYHLEHRVVSLPFFSSLDHHPFFNKKQQCPTLEVNNLDDPQSTQSSAKAVWVPNRNGVFLSIAAAFAESIDAACIYAGFNAEEAQTFPDNSHAFVTVFNQSLAYSTQNKVKIICPTISLNKTQILKQLIENRFPLELLWSCYNNNNKMCGRCESCARLKRALIKNNMQASNLFG